MNYFKTTLIFFAIFNCTLFANNLNFTNEEQLYISKKEKITMCVDPDWEPYEILNQNGKHIGIAADLIRLVSDKIGIPIVPVQTKTWKETLEFSKSGKCEVLSFVNDTPERRNWLIFTSSLLEDENIFIAKRGYPKITSPEKLVNQSIALPEGSGILEKVTKTYPNLKIVPVVSEKDAFDMVEKDQVNLTLRSMILSAYTIRKEAYFNLESVGFANDNFTNRLSMGVLKSETILRDILDKGIKNISEEEREDIINNHVYIKIEKGIDYTLAWQITMIAIIIIVLIVLYLRKLYLLKTQITLNYENLEKLINTQENIVILTDGKNLSFANQSFFNFFAYENLEQFKKDFNCINGKFVKNKQFFHLDKLNENKNWLDELNLLPIQQRIVGMIRSDFSLQVFSLTINKFDKTTFIVSFTNITQSYLCNIELQDKTIKDKLTNAYNREYFEQNYQKIIDNTLSEGYKLAVAFLDIDYFKSINDKFGHDMGDLVLIEFVKVIKKSLRNNDILIRWGGEEFILLLKIESQNNLEKILNNLRETIQEKTFENVGKITCSFGGTIYKDFENLSNTIKRADEYVYEAKRAGRNRVIVN